VGGGAGLEGLEFCLEDGVGVLEGQPESREVGLVGWGGEGGATRKTEDFARLNVEIMTSG
jgi:hypothetical protein